MQRQHTKLKFKEVLLRYTLCFLPQHASHFEKLSKKSSYPIICRALSTEYVALHLRCFDRICECQYIGRSNISPRDVTSPIELAIGHSLQLYVQDYLAVESSKVASSTLSSGIQSLRTALLHPLSIIQRHQNSTVSEFDQLRGFALNFVVRSPIHSRAMTLRVLVEKSSRVSDHELAEAIRWTPLEIVQLLLPYFPVGKLKLMTDASDNFKYEPKPKQVGPLWLIGGRKSSPDTEELLEMFLERGEEINEQCSSLGSAVHAQVEQAPYNYDPGMVELLIRHGADINTNGPQGNPLEYLWKKANGFSHIKMKHVSGYRFPIRHLIKLGAVNNLKDPNGLIPSVEQMQRFARSWADYQECKRYYREGPGEGAPI